MKFRKSCRLTEQSMNVVLSVPSGTVGLVRYELNVV